jgi:hypothetical protein
LASTTQTAHSLLLTNTPSSSRATTPNNSTGRHAILDSIAEYEPCSIFSEIEFEDSLITQAPEDPDSPVEEDDDGDNDDQLSVEEDNYGDGDDQLPVWYVHLTL